MTLLTTTSEIEYAGLLGQDTFAYTFRVDEKTDMNVTLDNVPVAQGDFTMTGLGTANGGNVILNTPSVADATVLLFRVVPLTQEVDYQPFDAFPAETHEGALDKLTMITQQNAADVRRSLRFPEGDLSDPELADVDTRKNNFLGFDTNGNLIYSAGTATVDASAVSTQDLGNYYSSVEVEGSLQELGETHILETTWTQYPLTLVGNVSGAAQGQFTSFIKQIGNILFVQATVQLTNVDTLNGSVTLAGLPEVASISGYFSIDYAYGLQAPVAAGDNLYGSILTGQDTVGFTYSSLIDANASVLTQATLTNTTRLRFSFWYYV